MVDRSLTQGPRSAKPYDEWMTRAWVIDAIIGTGVALAIAVIMFVDQATTAPVAYTFPLILGGFMLLRRRFPRAVLALTVVVLFVYYILGFPPIGIAVPVVAALYSASEAGWTWWSEWAALVTIGVSTGYRLWEGDESMSYVLGYEMVMNVAMMSGAIALGYGVRTRRVRRIEQVEMVRLSAMEQAAEADRRIQSERVEMARDLHDLVGHTMSVISLHTDVAREAHGRDQAAVDEALGRIRTATSDTMRELRATVRLLRATRPETLEQGVVSLAGVGTLIESTRASGVTVIYKPVTPTVRLSATSEAAAYRIIQESLTNVMKHAQASEATVTLEEGQNHLMIVVSDNGCGLRPSTGSGSGTTGSGSGTTPGHGITGMRERARLLGGDVVAGPEPTGGFAVRARLPVELSR